MNLQNFKGLLIINPENRTRCVSFCCVSALLKDSVVSVIVLAALLFQDDLNLPQ